METQFVFKLTPLAIEKAREQILKRKDTKGIRIGLRSGGCHGYYLTIEFANSIDITDHIFSFDDVCIIIDPKSMIFLNGTEMDYEKTLMKSGFKFNMPKSTGNCSCKESYNF